MKRRRIRRALFRLLLSAFGAVVFLALMLYFPSTSFQRESVFFVLKNQHNLHDVHKQLRQDSALRYGWLMHLFSYGVRMMGYDIAPGKYQIKKGMSTWDIARVLYGRKQYTIRLTIGKHRQWKDLISTIKKQVPLDSTLFSESFLELSNEEIADPSLLLTYIIPDSYYLYWTTSTPDIAAKLYARYLQFWNEKRLQQLENLRLSTRELYIIASLVEEETTYDEEKPLISSVYINRYRKRMYLGSCPSVKYALKQFDLRRILYKHLKVESPFNTYKNLGLPPGPICIPSIATLDAVLHTPKTDYLYFVADSEKSDRHLLSTSYREHQRKAKIYVNKIFRK